jgi:hypothetical protein
MPQSQRQRDRRDDPKYSPTASDIAEASPTRQEELQADIEEKEAANRDTI